MNDEKKTREQLINELEEFRRRIAELNASRTHRNRAEEALRESEERYRLLFEQSPIGIGLSSRDGKVVSANRAMETIMGYPIEELKGINLADTYESPEDRKRLVEAVNQDGGVVNYPVRLKRKDGNFCEVLLTISPVSHLGDRDFFQTICIDITERKNMEDELRESERRSRELADLLPEIIFEIDTERNVKFANQVAFDLFGYSQEDLDKGLDALEMFIPEERERVRKNMQRRLSGEEFGSIEYTAQRKDGTTFPVIIHSNPIIYEDKPVGLRGVIIDLTERKQAEKVLEESEQRYRQLFEGISDGVMVYSPQGRFLDCNEATLKQLGYGYEELLCLGAADIVHPDFHLMMKENRKRVWAGETIVVQSAYCCKDGRVIPAEVNARRIEYKGGSAILAVVRDITKRKRMQEALREQTVRNELILQTAMDGVWVTDMEGNIVEVNPAASIISGYSQEELVGMNICDLEAMETPQETTEHIKRFVKKGSDRFETKHRRKDGQILDVELRANLVEMDGKRFFFSFFHDITTRKQAEQAVKEREQELEIKTSNLEEVNAALRVLLKRREEDKTELEEKVLFNVRELIAPYLEKLIRSGLDERQKAYAGILQSNLNDIISPFSHRLSSGYLNLTPAEMQVANLVKHGKTTKEIAEVLNLSGKTIEVHRKNIRRKIGIKNEKANLRTHLLSIQ